MGHEDLSWQQPVQILLPAAVLISAHSISLQPHHLARDRPSCHHSVLLDDLAKNAVLSSYCTSSVVGLEWYHPSIQLTLTREHFTRCAFCEEAQDRCTEGRTRLQRSDVDEAGIDRMSLRAFS